MLNEPLSCANIIAACLVGDCVTAEMTAMLEHPLFSISSMVMISFEVDLKNRP